MVVELVKSGGRDSGRNLRLKEIDKELGRFDTTRGMISMDNLEGENEGIKEQMTARKAESTPELVDRHAEKLASAKGFTQSRVHEANLIITP